jgi:Domain of unknown function (DUF932)
MQGLMVHASAQKIGRQDLLALPTPVGTDTHRPIPHSNVIQALLESLAYRHLNVVKDEYAVTNDAMRMFGFLELEIEESGVRISLGVRNSHDKSFSLGLTVGFRVLVCDNLAFWGEFSPVMRKHTKHLVLDEVIGVSLERMQRNFKPLIQQVDVWKNHQLPDAQAKLTIYDAFIGDKLCVPKHLARVVHQEYFEPSFEEFKPRTMWSLNNAFTSAIKKLEPVPQYNAAVEIGQFFNTLN